MKRFMRLICVALVLAMAAGLAIGCGPAETGTSPGGAETGAGAGSGAGTGTPAGGGVVSDPDAFASRTIGVFSMLGRLYAGMSPPENHAASDGVFDVVFRPDLATGEVFSWILEDWRWEDEGTTLIMTMRDDIYFSNGAHATSRDLLYSYTSVPGRGAPTFAAFPIIWEETKVLDEFTMQMRFERPWPTIMRTIVYLINEEWSESVQWDDEAWLFPVGSGPYFVYQHIPDDRIVLRLRDEYWRTDISEYYIDEWIIRFIPDQSTLAMELELGNVHIAHLDSASYSRLLNHGAENVQPMLRSLGTTIYLNFGMVDAYPLWNDIRLR
ncbi:MAG: ABC transporter substrate-binding protein, partial [Oscillospiraceae bacterium]|nr:ABC transporter substrate-binding protein [Oscillospiraceae bacterium]